MKKFFMDESGASMVEYGLLVALIAVTLIAAINFLSGGVNATFNKAGEEMNTAAS